MLTYVALRIPCRRADGATCLPIIMRRHDMYRFYPTVLALLAIVTGCGSDGPTEPEAAACTDRTGSVMATVTGGSNPVFGWDPPCPVALLLVEGPGGDTWVIGSDDATWSVPDQANLISPPITYGTASLPPGVQTEYGPEPLTVGAVYDVILFRAVDPANAECSDLLQNMCRSIYPFTR
jgi:hypothetical protein